MSRFKKINNAILASTILVLTLLMGMGGFFLWQLGRGTAFLEIVSGRQAAQNGARAAVGVGLALFALSMVVVSGALSLVRNVSRASLSSPDQRLELFSQYSTEVIFDYDIKAHTTVFNGNFKKMFGYMPGKKERHEFIIDRKHVHKDDLESYLSMCRKVFEKEGNHSFETRIRNGEGKYLHCLIAATTVMDENKKAERVVGRITDISDFKKQYEDLVFHSQLDQETRLYNKVSGRQIINDLLRKSNEKDSFHAMLAIDIDDFKEINDNFGHLFGDVVLNDCVSRLKEAFRSTDILCRFGGDEFVVLVKNAGNREAVMKKANKLNKALNFVVEKDGAKVTVSVSIGIAFYPMHGFNFVQLYSKADAALYNAKRLGKNKSLLYNSNSRHENALHELRMTDYSGRQVYLSKRSFTEQAMTEVFDILYQSKDVFEGVHFVMDIVGRAYGFSHIFIYDYFAQDGQGKMVFDWYDTRMQQQEYFSCYCKGQKYLNAHCLEDNVCYCDSVSALPEEKRVCFEQRGVKSLLHVPLIQQGKQSGCLVYEDFFVDRRLTEEEIAVLVSVGRLAGLFLQYNELDCSKYTQTEETKSEPRANFEG